MHTYLLLILLMTGSFQVEDDRSKLLPILSNGNVDDVATLFSSFNESAEWSVEDTHWDIASLIGQAKGSKPNDGKGKSSEDDAEWSLDDAHWNIDYGSLINKTKESVSRDEIEEIIKKAVSEFHSKMGNETRDGIEMSDGENSDDAWPVIARKSARKTTWTDSEDHGRVIDYDANETSPELEQKSEDIADASREKESNPSTLNNSNTTIADDGTQQSGDVPRKKNRNTLRKKVHDHHTDSETQEIDEKHHEVSNDEEEKGETESDPKGQLQTESATAVPEALSTVAHQPTPNTTNSPEVTREGVANTTQSATEFPVQKNLTSDVDIDGDDANFHNHDHVADDKEIEEKHQQISDNINKTKSDAVKEDGDGIKNDSNDTTDMKNDGNDTNVHNHEDEDEMEEEHQEFPVAEEVEGEAEEDENEELPRIFTAKVPKQKPEMDVVIKARRGGRYEILPDRQVLLVDQKGNNVSVRIPLFRSTVLSTGMHSFTIHMSHGLFDGIQSWVMAVVKLRKDRSGRTLFLRGSPDDYNRGQFEEYSDSPEYDVPWITARFPADKLPYQFTVGDGRKYEGYENGELQSDESYGVFMAGVVHGLVGGLVYVESAWLVDAHSPEVPTYFRTNPLSNYFLPLFLALFCFVVVFAVWWQLWREGKFKFFAPFAAKVRAVARRKSRGYGARNYNFSDSRRKTKTFREKELKYFYRDANEPWPGSSSYDPDDPYYGYRNNLTELPTLKKPKIKGKNSAPTDSLKNFTTE